MKYIDEGYTILTFRDNEDTMDLVSHSICKADNMIMLEGTVCVRTVSAYLDDTEGKYVSYLIDNETSEMLFKVTCNDYTHLCTDYYPVPLDIGTSTSELIDELVVDELTERLGPKKTASLLAVLSKPKRS